MLVGNEWRICQSNRCLYSSRARNEIGRREGPKVLSEGAEFIGMQKIVKDVLASTYLDAKRCCSTYLFFTLSSPQTETHLEKHGCSNAMVPSISENQTIHGNMHK